MDPVKFTVSPPIILVILFITGAVPIIYGLPDTSFDTDVFPTIFCAINVTVYI